MPRGAPTGAVLGAVVAVATVASWPTPAQEAVGQQHVRRPTPAPSVVAEPARKQNDGFEVAVISDLNQSYGSTHYGKDVHAAVRALTERLRPGLLLVTGDMVAGQRADVDPPAMWRGFRAAVIEPLRRAGIALAPTPGNHDASPSFRGERAEYVKQWPAAEADLDFIDAEHYPVRYSFSYKGAFFLSLDAASVGPLSGAQLGWVEAQLRSAASFPVKIAFGHLPLHPLSRGREREILNDDALEALFTRYGVDLYASGHHHAYYPGVTASFRQLSMPCLGAGPRALIGTERASQTALVMLRVDDGSVSELEAFAAPDFSTTIPRSTLPPRIVLGRHLLIRDDLAHLE